MNNSPLELYSVRTNRCYCYYKRYQESHHIPNFKIYLYSLLEEEVGGGQGGVGEEVEQAQRQEGEDVLCQNKRTVICRI